MGFFDTLQKFLGEVSLLDYLRPSVRDGAWVFEAAKTGFGSSSPVGQNFLFQSFLLKDLWVPGRNCLFPEFSFKRSVVSKLGVQADWARPVGRNFLFPKFSFKRSVIFEAAKTGTGTNGKKVRDRFQCMRMGMVYIGWGVRRFLSF